MLVGRIVEREMHLFSWAGGPPRQGRGLTLARFARLTQISKSPNGTFRLFSSREILLPTHSSSILA